MLVLLVPLVFFVAMTPIPVVPLLSGFQSIVIAVRFAPLFQPLTIGTILAIVPVMVVTMVPVVVAPIISVIPLAVIPVTMLFLLLTQIGRCRLSKHSEGRRQCSSQQPRSKRSKSMGHYYPPIKQTRFKQTPWSQRTFLGDWMLLHPYSSLSRSATVRGGRYVRRRQVVAVWSHGFFRFQRDKELIAQLAYLLLPA